MYAVIIQARMGSTRLPKKTMMKIRNKPLLYYTIKQIQSTKKISKIISVSKTGVEQIEKMIGPTPAEVIYNGADTEFYNPNNYNPICPI